MIWQLHLLVSFLAVCLQCVTSIDVAAPQAPQFTSCSEKSQGRKTKTPFCGMTGGKDTTDDMKGRIACLRLCQKKADEANEFGCCRFNPTRRTRCWFFHKGEAE